MPATMPNRLPIGEFVALMGVMFATIAFSIDAMLPALGAIADDLSPDAPNRAQFVVTSFVLGMGLGTLVTGPLADAFGRRRVILAGAAVYILGAALATLAQSLEMLLAARVLQGLGASAPRVAGMAIIRDLFVGRQMARIMSYCLLVFTLIPAVAPLIGAGILWLSGWRAIFVAFVVFSLIVTTWFGLRQDETLAPENRRPFRVRTLASGLIEVAGNAQVMRVVAALSLVFAILFTTLATTQPIFETRFDRGTEFPLWFALIALISGLGSLTNARIVIRLGMRRVILGALIAQAILAAAMSALALVPTLPGELYFAAYVIWLTSIFLTVTLTIGNLNALGMEPLGHLAGLGASIISAVATIAAVVLAVPFSLVFDGTPGAVAPGFVILAVLAVLLIRRAEDGAPADMAGAD